jgi:hypothetical protein
MRHFTLLVLVTLLLCLASGCSGVESASDRLAPAGGQASASGPQPASLLYLRGQTVYRMDSGSEESVGPLPAGAGHLTPGPAALAYVEGSRVATLGLAEGAPRVAFDLGERPGRDQVLCWSADVELGVATEEEQRVIASLIARPAGPTPTPKPEPPPDPQPGFANLSILGFDQGAERLAVVPAGGQDRYSAVWFYDMGSGERVQTVPLPEGVGERALSPNLVYLAYSQLDPTTGEASYVVYDVAQQASVVSAATPAGTHAASLCWSPASEALAYMVREGASPGLAISDSTGLYVLDITTGEAHEVPYTASPEAHIVGWTGDAEGLIVQGLDAETMAWRVERVDVASGKTESFAVPAEALILGVVQ